MDIPSPNPPAWRLSRAEDFLAGLIYIDSMRRIIGQDFNANAVFSKNAQQWTIPHCVHSQLEETRHRLVNTMHSMDLACLDNTLNSFVDPIPFYEAAVSGFHNTLLGLPPTTLGDIVALCAMSHTTLCCLNSTGNQISFGFDLWRNAISNHEHRQPFDDLIKAACLEPYLTALMDVGHSQQFIFPVAQYGNEMSNEAPDLSLDPNLTTLNSFFTSQNPHFSHIVSESTQLINSTQAPDLQSLQGSPIVANLARFLEECGELPLSSRGATVKKWLPIGSSKPAESGAEHSIERLYIQLLQDDECFNDPTAQGILSVVDRFIGLGYLQNASEMRDCLLLLGKGILPNDKAFLDFIEIVQRSMIKAENQNEYRCERCGKLFTRKPNMRRHMKSISCSSQPRVNRPIGRQPSG